MTLGERIRKGREDLGMTQAELGQYLGVLKSTISMYENNNRRPGYDRLLKLCLLFELDLTDLFGAEPSFCQDPTPDENEKDSLK